MAWITHGAITHLIHSISIERMPINIYPLYFFMLFVMYLCLINVIIGINYNQKRVFRIAPSWTGKVDRADP